MDIILVLLMATVCACLGRAAGGGLGAEKLNKKGAVDELGRDKGGIMPFSLSMLPEILFGAVLAVPVAFAWGFWAWLAAAAWCYLWMETGHGTAYTMGRNPNIATKIDPKTGKVRKQRLSYVVDPICRLLGKPLGGTFYSWLFMGLKGFLIGLPFFPFGLTLAFLWPASYEYGMRLREKRWVKEHNVPAEFLSCAFAGLCSGLALTFLT